jgi:hypothetical protein
MVAVLISAGAVDVTKRRPVAIGDQDTDAPQPAATA